MGTRGREDTRMRLAGQVAIVTGASSGFGRATALRFAEEGARLVLGDLDGAGGLETVALVECAGSVAELVVGDVASGEVATALVERAVARFGHLDVLVNNAGIAPPERSESWNAPEESWDRVLRVNLKSVYLCCRAAIPAMLGQGSGSIVNVASIAATRAVGGASYAAAKGGILSYTRFVSRELAPHGVRVNCVSPGYMRTPMSTGERHGLTEAEQDARMEHFARRVPMRRSGAPTDIADAIVYLASAEAGYITGQELVVDGGYLVG
jgi:NAD(P)-dependent dehydrogenase (short-subunit alcohol dehydrogenase family)